MNDILDCSPFCNFHAIFMANGIVYMKTMYYDGVSKATVELRKRLYYTHCAKKDGLFDYEHMHYTANESKPCRFTV